MSKSKQWIKKGSSRKGRMETLSVRIEELMSHIDNRHHDLIKMQLECNYKDDAIKTIHKIPSLANMDISDQEINQMIMLLRKPNTNICTLSTNNNKNNKENFSELKKRTNRILVKQNKIKNLSMFKERKNMGATAQLHMQIGKEINELHLTHLNETDIKTLTYELEEVIDNIKKEDIDSKKYDDTLLKFDIETFCFKLDEENRAKKKKLKAKQKNKINLDKKKKPQINNAKSTKCVQKYNELLNAYNDQCSMEFTLSEIKNDLLSVCRELRIMDENEQCHQEAQWENVFDDTISPQFIGKDAYQRFKSLSKQIKTVETKVQQNKKQLKESLNEVTWRKYSGAKSKKTMRERAGGYSVGLEKRRNRYHEKKQDTKKISGKKRKNKKETLSLDINPWNPNKKFKHNDINNNKNKNVNDKEEMDIEQGQ